MRKQYVLLAFLLTAIIVGLSWYAHPPSEIDRLFGGSANVAVLRHPTRVEAFRIGPLPEGISPERASISDYPVVSGPTVLSPEIAKNVSETLLSPNTYIWDTAKSCIPAFGVQLSFIRGVSRVDILLCFECDILVVGRDGQALGGEDFDNGRLPLVRAAKAAFPEDEIIQKLEEN